MIARDVFYKMSVTQGVFSVSDAVYLSFSDFNDDSELERVRMKLLKYREILARTFTADEIRLLDVKARDFANGGNLQIKIENGWIRFLVPFNDRIERNFKDIKGWRWQSPFHVFPAENGVRPLKIAEEVFDVYLDVENTHACFAAVGVLPDTRTLKLIVFRPCKSMSLLLEDSSADYDAVSNSYDIKISSLKEFAEKARIISETKGEIQFVFHSSTSRINEMRRLLLDDDNERNGIRTMSSEHRTGERIKSPRGLTPYGYQIIGEKYIEKTNARTLVADEMGLGKTVETCLYLYNHPDKFPIIVVVPNSLKVNWFREMKKWCELKDDEIQIIRGSKKDEKNNVLKGKKAYIISYGSITARMGDIKSLGLRLLVIDEGHYIKNYGAKRTKSCFEIGNGVGHVIVLAGTPIINKTIDLWSIIVITKNANYFGGFWNFVRKYCGAYETKWGWNFDGSTNQEELQSKLRERMMIRRLKSQVLPDLPKKRRLIVPVEINNRTTYEKASKDFKKWYLESTGKQIGQAEYMVRIEKLKQIAYKGKKDELVGFIEDTAQNYDKIIVFFSHKDYLSEMREELHRGFTLDTLTADNFDEERQEICDYFNEKDKCILLCASKVAREGLNLQTAQVVIFAELEWTAALHDQAEDRAHRIGQENILNVYYVVAENTVEEDIVKLINSKQEKSSEVVGGNDDVLKDYIDSIGKEISA